jgi:5-formyltetrahydrofolate cyclo-ligase
MISEEKQSLRLRVLEMVRAMDDAARAEKSAMISARLRKLKGVVFGFAPMRFEPDWTNAIGRDRTGGIGKDWTLALPRIENGKLSFHRVTDLSALVPGPFGTREPVFLGDEIPPAEADVILTPGVAFDRSGARLGRGGGFYDRLLADGSLKARRIAVCFTCQIVERVPVESHDAPVDEIVTPGGWLYARNSAPGRD